MRDATVGAPPTRTVRTERDENAWRTRARAALTEALACEESEVAERAALALGRAGEANDVARLVSVLVDRDRSGAEREAAALALGLLPGAEDVVRQSLQSVASSPKEPKALRSSAIYALGLRGDEGALPFLLTTAAPSRDADPDLAGAGATALGLGGDRIVRPDLESLLTSDHGRHAAHGLARLGDAAALPALRKAARRDDPLVRRSALLSLGALAEPGDDATADVLVRALHRDKDVGCRNAAAISLGRLGHRRSPRALRYAYKKGSRHEQPFAALGLGLLARKTQAAGVLQLLRKDLARRANAELRGALAIAVGLGGDAASAPTLREIVDGASDAELRAHAALALGMVGDSGKGSELLRRIVASTHDARLQRDAAVALGILGDAQTVHLLVTLSTQCTCTELEGASQIALGRIGGRDGVDALIAILGDDARPERSRAMAAAGLGIALDRRRDRDLGALAADADWYSASPTLESLLELL